MPSSHMYELFTQKILKNKLVTKTVQLRLQKSLKQLWEDLIWLLLCLAPLAVPQVQEEEGLR